MATNGRSQTSVEGGLYELVARGVKDKYFFKDEKDAVHPFQWTFDRYPACLPEERWTQPLNQIKFGARCEFEFDLPGDILLEAALSIELPSWLTPPFAERNGTTLTHEEGFPDRTYGYVRGIAYFLFERIELYQDNILLQEVSGDSLYFAARHKDSWNQGYLTQKLAGDHDGSALSIQRNATPGKLELRIPMIGCATPGDRGLPIAGIRNQAFRLRLTLRSLDRLIECSDPAVLQPKPWKLRFTQGLETAAAVPLEQIGQPIITLRTKQLYLTNEAAAQVAADTFEVPYIRYFDNVFGANQLDYAPIPKGGTAYLVKYLDATFTVERIVTYFRNSGDVARNRLWQIENLYNPSGDYYSNLQLTIAGQLREGIWGPSIWELATAHAKEERFSKTHLPLLSWTRGWRTDDMPPAVREPTGGINFTTADRPMTSAVLTDIAVNPVLGYKQSELNQCCESWAVYKIEKGRGKLLYYN